jgi:hypothetical protein
VPFVVAAALTVDGGLAVWVLVTDPDAG